MVSNPKQMLIWRNDLRNTNGQKVRSGKIAAQLAHASMKAILDLGSIESDSELIIPLDDQATVDWIKGSFTKVAVYVNSEAALIDLINKAKEAGLITSLIIDNGLTEFGNVPTMTCGAIGPAYPEQLKDITGHLPLL